MEEMLRKEDVLKALSAKIDELEKRDAKADVILGLATAMSVVKLMTCEPAEKVGQWIIKMRVNKKIMVAGIKTWYLLIICDKCGFIKTIMEEHKGQYKFCPNCGQPKIQEVNNEQ